MLLFHILTYLLKIDFRIFLSLCSLPIFIQSHWSQDVYLWIQSDKFKFSHSKYNQTVWILRFLLLFHILTYSLRIDFRIFHSLGSLPTFIQSHWSQYVFVIQSDKFKFCHSKYNQTVWSLWFLLLIHILTYLLKIDFRIFNEFNHRLGSLQTFSLIDFNMYLWSKSDKLSSAIQNAD